MKDYFEGQHVEWTDLNKDDRERMRPIVGAIILGSSLAALLLYIIFYLPKAFAEEIPLHVVEQPEVKLRLMPGPCVDQVGQMFLLAQVPEHFHARFKAISSDWRMQDGQWKAFEGCWIELTAQEAGHSEPVIFMIFNDGATVGVPKSELLKKPGQAGA